MKSSRPQQTGTQVVTQTNDPWSGQQPFLEKGFQRAETDVLGKPETFFPGSTVVPFDPLTTEALGSIESRARAGSPLVSTAQEAIRSAASGDLLAQNPFLSQDNPYLQSAIDAASRGITRNYESVVEPGIDAAFSSRGRYGSGLQAEAIDRAQENLASQLGDVGTQMAFGDYGMQRQGYDTERARQMAAASAAPGMAAQDYVDPGQLLSVGAAREGQAASQLQEDINRFNLEQTAEKKALADYMALVAGGQYGGAQTTSTPLYGDTSGNVLGNIAQLAGIGGSLFGLGGPFGGKPAGWS
jgi:hypothetical protein